jgi:predicted dienelactone hydrolase
MPRTMAVMAMLPGVLGVSLALAACGDPVPPDLGVEHPGAFAVGTRRFDVHDAPRTRDLAVQAWFPTTSAVADTPIEQLEVDPTRTRYADLLAMAPACPSRSLPVAADAAPAAGTFPVVLLSHCHACTRLSNATTAIRLASHGFIALAVEHAGDTLWEKLDGTEAPIDAAELEIRAADVRAVLDAVAAGDTPVSANADLEHVGVLGHSMGAVTAGRVAQLDSRIDGAVALCAPMENPLVPGVSLADLTMPLMFVVAVEDNSITELGNNFIRDNFDAAPGPAYKLEIAEAGHWSVSDLVGLVPAFEPGCGDGIRQTDDQPFTYLDPAAGRGVAAAYATAFFKSVLLDDAGARSYLESASSSLGATLVVSHR